MTEISIWEKEKWRNKGTDKQYVAVFCYTIQLITIKLCTKFQNPNPSSCWEIFDRKKKVYRQTNRQTDKPTNIITEKAKLIYPLYTSYRGYKHSPMCTQNFETLAPIGAEKSVTEISIWEKEKWRNKGTDKQYVAVFFVTQYNSSLSSFVPNFRILTQVVAEQPLTEKKVYRQTNRQTDKQT